MAFCINCGAELKDNAKFCISCGASVDAAEPQAGFEPPQPVPVYQPVPEQPPAPEPDHVAVSGSYTPPQQSYAPPQQGYTPPQQSYQPQQYAAAPAVAVKKRGLKEALPLIIVGVALIAIAAILLVVFLGGGNKNAKCIGKWNCIGYESMGVRISTAELGESSLEFKSNGKLVAVFLGSQGSGRWTEDDDGDVTIKSGGEELDCEKEGNLLVLEYMGVKMYFEKEGTVPSAADSFIPKATEPPVVTEPPVAEPSASDYVGYWETVGIDWGEGDGIETDYFGAPVSTFLAFELYEDGTVDLVAYDESVSGTWDTTADGISITVEGEAQPFDYIDGQLVLTAGSNEDRTVAYFEMVPGHITLPDPGAGNTTYNDVVSQWGGYWYGSFYVTKTYGSAWASYNGTFSDFYGYINVDENGDGYFEADFEDFEVGSDYYEVVLSMWIEADTEHFEQVRDEAWFSDMDIIEGESGLDYYVTPDPDNPNMFIVNATYIDPDGNGTDGYDYTLVFVRYGYEWDYDVYDTAPPGYDEYLDEIDADSYPTSGPYFMDSLTVDCSDDWNCSDYDDELDFYFTDDDYNSLTVWLNTYDDEDSLDYYIEDMAEYSKGTDIKQLNSYEADFGGHASLVYEFFDDSWEECATYIFVRYNKPINGDYGFRLYCYSYDYDKLSDFLANPALQAFLSSITVNG